MYGGGPPYSSRTMAGSDDKRRESIAEQRRRLPDQPGVYMLSDGDGRVVYVGKSRSIRKRVASHFSSRTRLSSLNSRRW